MIEAVAEDEAAVPPYALYSLRQIKWTALIGGPLVATMMMRDNFRKLGQPKQARWTWIIGGGAMLALMTLSILAEQRLGRSASFSLGVPLALGAAGLARRTQGAALESHWKSGGRAQPFWKVLLVFVLSLGLLLVGTSQLMGMLSTTARLEGGHEVSLEGDAQETDAARAGSVLTEVGFLSAERPIHFALGRNDQGWSLELNLASGAAHDEKLRPAFEEVAKALRERAFGGAPLQIRLADRFGFVQKRLDVDGLGGVTWR